MRINATDTNLSRYVLRPENLYAQDPKNSNPFLPANYQDRFSASRMGELLRCQGEAIAVWNERITKPDDDPALALMDRSMSAVGELLERMKTLTLLAQDERMSGIERMGLQIEMGKLQQELSVETKKMSLRMAGQSEAEIAHNLGLMQTPEKTPEGGMLERALKRLRNGEEWDIREQYEPITRLKEVHLVSLGGGKRVVSGETWEQSGFPADLDPGATIVVRIEESDEGHFTRTDDPETPSVSETLKANNAILLMDSKSAKEGTEKIEQQLVDLRAMREEFAVFCQANRAEPQPTIAFDKKKLSETEVVELQAQIARERQAKEEEIERNIRLQNGGTLSEDEIQKMNDPQSRPNSRGQLRTRVGIMTYSTDENGVEDRSDPRLRQAEGPYGGLFAKLESLFKDKINKTLGIKNLSV